MENCRETSQGSSLIEVMVALFVLAIGLLGVLAMQTRSVQLNQNAYMYSQAAILANDLMEIIQTSDAPKAIYYGYQSSPPSSPNDCAAAGADCDSSQIAAWSYDRWAANVQQVLPGGDGRVERVTTGSVSTYRIVVEFEVANDPITGDPIEHNVSLEIGS